VATEDILESGGVCLLKVYLDQGVPAEDVLQSGGVCLLKMYLNQVGCGY